MPRVANCIGKKLGMLTVVERTSNSKHGASRWICRCECGNEIVLTYEQVKRGSKKDCGCIKRPHHNATHGASRSPLYNHWKMMLYRCENPKNRAYKYYGERGIQVCEEWHDFNAFKKWLDESGYVEGLTVDRIDNNKGYCPENCRLTDSKTQANNRRSNVEITYNGQTHNLTEWSEILGFDYKQVHNRMHKLGWDFEKALLTPTDKKKRNKVERKKSG